jgi:hypothetical protein
MANSLDIQANATSNQIRSLDAAEIDQVGGGKIKAIIVLGDCTTPPIHSIDGIRVIIYNPWITPRQPGAGRYWDEFLGGTC